MPWTIHDTWIVLTASCCALAAALPGCFLILRKLSMMGDAISHAVLPGLAIGFLLSESRSSWPMFVGAASIGIFTALLTDWIQAVVKVDKGAAMGVVFTSFFALGLLLIETAADSVDLDPSCVLYGAIELTPFDTIAIGNLQVPRSFCINAIIMLANLSIILLLFKELRIAAFDPALARSQGFSPQLLHYLLMAIVAVTTVAAFQSVGSIIVIAMLIAPAAIASMLTRKLPKLLLLSCIFAVSAAILGHIAAREVPAWVGAKNTTTSGMITVVLGIFFVLAWLFFLLQNKRKHSSSFSNS